DGRPAGPRGRRWPAGPLRPPRGRGRASRRKTGQTGSASSADTVRLARDDALHLREGGGQGVARYAVLERGQRQAVLQGLLPAGERGEQVAGGEGVARAHPVDG